MISEGAEAATGELPDRRKLTRWILRVHHPEVLDSQT